MCFTGGCSGLGIHPSNEENVKGKKETEWTNIFPLPVLCWTLLKAPFRCEECRDRNVPIGPKHPHYPCFAGRCSRPEFVPFQCEERRGRNVPIGPKRPHYLCLAGRCCCCSRQENFPFRRERACNSSKIDKQINKPSPSAAYKHVIM